MKAAPGNALRFASPTVNAGKSERADPGALLYLSQPLAGDLVLFFRLVYQEAEEDQGYVHEVVGVERDERERDVTPPSKVRGARETATPPQER